MKKSLLVAAVLLSIGSGCLLPNEVGATNYYWKQSSRDSGEWVTEKSEATASGNTAKLPNDDFSWQEDDNFYAGYASGIDVENNSITIENINTSISNVYGGYRYGGDSTAGSSQKYVQNNKVLIASTIVSGSVYGGYFQQKVGSLSLARVKENIVNITDGKVLRNVYGGFNYGGLVCSSIDNKVNISGGEYGEIVNGKLRGGNIYGGYLRTSDNSYVTGNEVTISKGTILGSVYGGYIDSTNEGSNNDVKGNVVTIAGGEVGGDVYGGLMYYDGSVKENIVNWQDGSIKGSIYGGYGVEIEIKDNILNVYQNSDGTAKTLAEDKNIAGFDYMNFYTNNPEKPVVTVTNVNLASTPKFGVAVKNGTILETGTKINLLQARYGLNGNFTPEKNYKINTLILEEGYMPIYASEISSIQNIDNVLTLTYKGFDESLDRVIFGGEEGSGYVKVAGDSLDNIKANDQKLNLNSDSYNFFAAVGGFSKEEDVSGNKVTIDGATVGKEAGASTTEIAEASFGNGDVYGGYALDAAKTASDNEVTWKSGDIKGSIYGGYVACKAVTGEGNTLNIYHSSGSSSKTISAGKSIAGFDNMNFYLSGDIKADSVIIDNSKANAVKMDGVSVSLENDPDKALDSDFMKGDKIYLIKKTEGSIDTKVVPITANGMDYDFEVSTTDDSLIAKSLSDKKPEPEPEPGPDPKPDPKPGPDPHKRPNEETKALLEGHAAAALAVNQMVDNTINVALKDAELAALANDKDSAGKFNAFVSANYNKDRISTGSYVDVKGLSGTIGIARKLNNKSGALTYGLFLEGGKNKFDASNDFASGTVHGKGDANSFGGGFFAKQKNANGMYVEGSLRVGRVNHDFEGFVAKQNAEYDAKSTYYGAHIGLGKLINAGKGEWDIYGKLIYTHINGATANVYDGSELELDAMNSTRLRVGGRYNVNPAPKAVGYYAGLAYEYEFGGQADGKLQGFGLEAPTSKGSTGILELGAKFQPTQNFGIDLGVEGHAGKRRGVGGNVNFKWSF